MKRAELEEMIKASMDEALKTCKEDNPIAAWSLFIASLDCAGRRRIGDRLEAAGKNRYTGEPVKAMPTAALEGRCETCWCNTCGNFDDCIVDIPGYDLESEPCPCDGCVNGGPPYAPKPTPPPCGRYVKGE